MTQKNQNSHSGNKNNFAENHELASEAGRKGGQHSHGHQGGSEVGTGKENDPNNFANDRKKASEAGRKGGKHS
jgi:uncharacterized protein